MIWKGVFPAVTTKFDAALDLDRAAMERHFSWQVDCGVDGLVTTGSLGEASTLTPAEKAEVARIALSAARGRVPVVATVAETTTNGAIAFARDAAKAGVAGLMVLPGMLYVSDRREAVTHLKAVARAVDLPVMIYSNRVAYRVDFDMEALDALAEVENIVAIKESSDDIRRVLEIRRAFGDRYAIFAGVDNLALESLAMGADGWIAGLVNALPEETVAIYRLACAGRMEEAIALYTWFLPLLKLDVSTKLVQNIKLVESVLGVGTETVRPPRLALVGEERDFAMGTIKDAMDRRASLPPVAGGRIAS